MSYDSNNIFAKILRGEAPCTRLYEDDKTLAFLDLFPQSPGHSLVIPKARARDMLDCPPEAAAAMIWTTQVLARAINKALKPDGIMLGQFNRAPAGQTIFHVHFHIIPRWSNVQLKGHGQANKAEPAELERLAADIKAAL